MRSDRSRLQHSVSICEYRYLSNDKVILHTGKHEGPQTPHYRDQIGYARHGALRGAVANSRFLSGSSSIVHEKTHEPLLSILSLIVETAVALIKDGHRVVIVSSGAIAVGLRRMDVEKRPKYLPRIQVERPVYTVAGKTDVNEHIRPWQR